MDASAKNTLLWLVTRNSYLTTDAELRPVEYCDHPLKNLKIAPQSLEAALEKVATPDRRVEDQRMFDGLADRPVSGEHPDSWTWPTKSHWSAWMKDTVRDVFSGNVALMKIAVVGLFGDIRQATESRSDIRVIKMVQTVVSRTAINAFQSSAFQTPVDQGVYKCMADAHITNDVATRTIDSLSLRYQCSNLLRSRLRGVPTK